MEKGKLSNFIAFRGEDIKNAFVIGNDINPLPYLQELIVLAAEEELIDLLTFIRLYNSQSTPEVKTHKLDNLDKEVYMAVLNTIKARIVLLRRLRELQHTNIIKAVDSIIVGL
jgi:hypothetical protein